jgi:D-alanyl-D-alanine carboxypeptidase
LPSEAARIGGAARPKIHPAVVAFGIGAIVGERASAATSCRLPRRGWALASRDESDVLRLRRLEQLLFVSLLACPFACSEAGTDARHGVSPDLRADLRAVLDGAVEGKMTRGAALYVATADGSTWSAAAGVGDLETHRPLTPNDKFRAGSILKPFVATAVLEAVERGVLGLDDVLTDRLPPDVTARIKNADTIRIDMLLGHRSGIPDWLNGGADRAVVADPEHIYSLDEILAEVARLSPAFAPGASYQYSNTNYVLLGEILSRVSGRSWREEVRDLFARSSLEQSSLPEPGDSSCPAPCAHGYVELEGEVHDTTRVDPSMAGAAGGHALLTTTADVTRFFRHLRSGELFEHRSTLDAMFAFRPDPKNRLDGYGLGVMKMESIDGPVLGHLGVTTGYQTFMLYIPATDRYVSGFINGTGDLDALLWPVISRAGHPICQAAIRNLVDTRLR